ncbi:MAG: methyltransferase, partial [Eubacteriales bacterium]
MSETLFGGLRFSTEKAFPLSTDTVVLADFVRLSKGAKVCDLGMGSGALTFLLQVRHPTAHFSGIELNPSAYEMAHQNIIDNHLEDSCVAYHKDLRLVSSFLPANGFTHVVSNPPYFSQGSGFVHGVMASARGEETCALSDLCESAKWLLQYGGTFSLVYRPERL